MALNGVESNSNAGLATAATLLQARSQFQVSQLRQSARQDAGVAAILSQAGGGPSQAAPGQGRGQIVDILA